MAPGFGPVWFGLIVVMRVEIARISPPDGTVPLELQGMRKDGGPTSDVFSGAIVFMLVYILAIVDPDGASGHRPLPATGVDMSHLSFTRLGKAARDPDLGRTARHGYDSVALPVVT